MPALKEVVKPPSEVSVVAKFNERVSHLVMDKDRDVAAYAAAAHETLQALERTFLAESKSGRSEADLLNAQKEEEEREMAVVVWPE